MNILTLTSVVISLTCFPLFFIIAKNAGRDRTKWFMALFTLAVGMWGFGNIFISLESDPQRVVLFWRLTRIAVIAIPVFLLHFIVLFLDKQKYYWLVVVSYLFGALGELVSVVGIFSRYTHSLALLGIFVGYFITVVLVVHYWLIKEFSRAQGLWKRQIQYVLLGTGLGFIGGTPSFLPAFGVDVYPVLNFGVALFPIFVAIGVFRYHLMDIRIIIRRSTVFALLVAVITGLYSLLLIFGSEFFKNLLGPQWQMAINIAVAALIVVAFHSLKSFIQKLTGRFFFHGEYETRELLTQLNQTLSRSLDTHQLFEGIAAVLTPAFYPHGFALYIYDKPSKALYLRHDALLSDQPVEYLTNDDPLVTYLTVTKKILIGAEAQQHWPSTDPLRTSLRRLSGEVVIPLMSKDGLLGVLVLGFKWSRDSYSAADIALLEIIGPHIAVALENVFLYEELQKFNATLTEEIQRATATLKTANQELADLNERQSQFFVDISHELQTPLAIIHGNLNLIEQEYHGSKNIRTSLTSLQQLSNLVNNILLLAKADFNQLDLKNESVDISSLLAELYDQTAIFAEEKNIVYELSTSNDLVVVGDREKLRGVILNLVSNAFKHTPSGGRIDLVGRQADDRVIIECRNSGSYIPAAEIPNVFIRFYRLSQDNKKGNGLGLAISKVIVEKHGGMIEVESDETIGTTFRVILSRATS